MVFKCQDDSFLKEFTSTVVSCEKLSSEGNCESFEVILDDTILFPEGGGQPCDHGFLNGVPVKKVLRRTDKAVHYVPEPIEVGSTVKQTINWERRFDHMQQHSGQHLLSAILEQHFKANTVSWWLGEEDSYVELDVPTLKEDDLKRAECMVNDYIRQGRDVTVTVYPMDTPEDVLEKVRSVKGLPEDHKGDIRVINIEGIDSNMCCGTHVKNLSQLQMMKLLYIEKSKRKDNSLLHFLFGNRVLNRLECCLDREKKLTMLLNNNPCQHVELVEKLQKNVKILNKNLQNVAKELAFSDARKLKSTNPLPKYFFLYRKDAEIDFINSFLRELGNTEVFLFLAVGDEKKEGNILLQGKEEILSELGPKVCQLLEGKGAGKGTTYRAKVSKMIKRKDAEKLIADYFNQLNQ
ncbi:unnamed protein product [Phyllotreta striolata]|uniref:Alanyl-transfer RNA synthetases family profile domain-containing protein n=1 Tax=Phyllotreta striolata TaxID=444603 RepID=A0A9N9TRX8_PHYSR|nr:unnamed protein product [Phyllotreta striolata]